MALDITHVQAGELITSTKWNELIDELEAIEARVTKLEQTGVTSGAVEITAVSPTTVHVGDEITIVGKNFQWTTGGTRVRFNKAPPVEFAGDTNDSLIICTVPDLGVVIPDGGVEATLSVSNTTTTATRDITVLPEPQEQSGTINVTFASVAPDPVLPSRDADFEFTLVSSAALPATLVVNPRVTTPAGAALGWTTRVLNAAKTEIGNRQVSINPGQTIAIFVRASVPAGTLGTQFVVEVDVAGSGVGGTGDAVLTVGQASNLDSTITKLSASSASGTGVSLVGGVLTVPANEVATLSIEADFTVPGDYLVTLAPSSGTNGWTVEMTDPAPGDGGIATLTVTEADVRNGGGTANEALEFGALPATNATSGQVVLTVQRGAQSKRRVLTFDLRKVGG